MKLLFTKRSIAGLSLGEMLKLRREEKGVSVEQSAAAVHVKAAQITALEQGRYQELPAGLYAKNILRRYCAFLKVSYRAMLALYESERGGDDDVSDKKIFGRERVRRSYFFILPKVWRGSILLVVVLAGFFYIGLRVNEIISPPALDVDFPPLNYIVEEHTVTVSGRVEPSARLFINEREVVAAAGNFSESIDLKTGVNDITVRAQKKYGRDARVILHVLAK